MHSAYLLAPADAHRSEQMQRVQASSQLKLASCVQQSADYLPIPLPLSLDCCPPGCSAVAALGVCTGVF